MFFAPEVGVSVCVTARQYTRGAGVSSVCGEVWRRGDLLFASGRVDRLVGYESAIIPSCKAADERDVEESPEAGTRVWCEDNGCAVFSEANACSRCAACIEETDREPKIAIVPPTLGADELHCYGGDSAVLWLDAEVSRREHSGKEFEGYMEQRGLSAIAYGFADAGGDGGSMQGLPLLQTKPGERKRVCTARATG